MRAYQIRDYGPPAKGAEHLRIRDAQGAHFTPLRYCGTLDVARVEVARLGFGANDDINGRAADIMVVEVEIATDKAAVLQLLNRGEPVGASRRAWEGKAWEIGPRGGITQSKETEL